MSHSRRLRPLHLVLITLTVSIVALYLFDLGAVGVLGPDEPRYSAIGQAMLRNGDYITPKLWGSPWFEKPPLLYWLTAAGAASGLSQDLAGRVPVAVASLVFLATSFVLLRREFGLLAAGGASVMLATSAGWLAYSSLCLTDIPLSIAFSLAVFLCLPLLREQPDRANLSLRFIAIGVCLGLGTLAKGLVPVALTMPFAWYLRSYWRQWWLASFACLAVALPWYLLVYLRNGYPFIEEFFIRHHLQRLYSDTLQHGQPAYYYVPVLLGALFPWTPVLLFLVPGGKPFDTRERFLLAVSGFGLLFFSCSLNKLPGYLLPLLPPLFAAVAGRISGREVVLRDRRWLAPCAVLVALIPLVAEILPPSLTAGRVSLVFLHHANLFLVFSCIPFAVLFTKRTLIAPSLALCAIAGGLLIKVTAYPVMDREVSARGLWKRVEPVATQLCDAGANRDWIYGLSFYRDSFIHYCVPGGPPLAIRSRGHGQPDIGPLH